MSPNKWFSQGQVVQWIVQIESGHLVDDSGEVKSPKTQFR